MAFSSNQKLLVLVSLEFRRGSHVLHGHSSIKLYVFYLFLKITIFGNRGVDLFQQIVIGDHILNELISFSFHLFSILHHSLIYHGLALTTLQPFYKGVHGCSHHVRL